MNILNIDKSKSLLSKAQNVHKAISTAVSDLLTSADALFERSQEVRSKITELEKEENLLNIQNVKNRKLAEKLQKFLEDE